MKTIEYFEESGVMGGQKGLSVDLTNKTITYWHGKKEKIREDGFYYRQVCILTNFQVPHTVK
jgi:hypothetical protein